MKIGIEQQSKHLIMTNKNSTIRWQRCKHGCIRQLGTEWLLLNHRCKGWNSFSYSFATLEDLQDYMNVVALQQLKDEWGNYFEFAKNMNWWSA